MLPMDKRLDFSSFLLATVLRFKNLEVTIGEEKGEQKGFH